MNPRKISPTANQPPLPKFCANATMTMIGAHPIPTPMHVLRTSVGAEPAAIKRSDTSPVRVVTAPVIRYALAPIVAILLKEKHKGAEAAKGWKRSIVINTIGAVTTGVVYAVGPLQGLGPSDWVQSDLQLAPGNSGGPLADASGTVMGLNTMISGRLALAVTSFAVRRFLRAQDPSSSLGVTLHPVQISSGGARRFGLLLVEVAGTGRAAQASLLPGDILVGTDAGPFTALQDLEEALDGEGERVVQLHFLRGGRAAVRKAPVLLGRARSRAA